ncbi:MULTISPECIES: sigma-70 family RNA polymerase sigma factor [Paenibacillus]|uniref:sigma-70 family RNA polymerase sigma factor n=1 Tax=Paenibacillus TaxID=44249 RepID=UPI002DBC48E0|nr:sigma-70 family RNA polymerase sigma factor [Paenibacillus macerans]MEC0330091.1 sigma-70 family RNA polymerase sigma factor [Paenibacillus macerans]
MLAKPLQREFQSYCARHKPIFENRVIQSFFRDESNIILLLKSQAGQADHQMALETGFRKHYFQIRFTRYLSSTIKYAALERLRFYRKIDRRNPLIFDVPLSDGRGGRSLGEALTGSVDLFPSDPAVASPEQFQETFTNPCLFNAFSKLSAKQQIIVTMSYALCYKDHEIAAQLNISPQAVNKTRNLALKKLRQMLTKSD